MEPDCSVQIDLQPRATSGFPTSHHSVLLSLSPLAAPLTPPTHNFFFLYLALLGSRFILYFAVDTSEFCLGGNVKYNQCEFLILCISHNTDHKPFEHILLFVKKADGGKSFN